MAATTWGTNDLWVHWRDFAGYVRQLGPIDVYRTHLHVAYNHPPLVGWLLVAINQLVDHGLSFRFLIRVPASVADVATAVLVFELARVRRSLTEATVAGFVVALSPVLVVVSGFHGNTDPVFVMFTLLSAYLVLRDRPVLAGASAATAVSIKLVPIVALPVLFVAVAQRRGRIVSMTLGFAAVFVPLWGTVIARQWTGYQRNVLGYKGLAPKTSQWGIVDLARYANDPHLLDLLVGPGRFAAVAISSLIPTYFVWRRRDAVGTAAALSLTLFLVLTTNFGTQYLAWAAAAVMLLDVWGGAAYNATAGLLLVIVYTHWTDGFPWYRAHATRLTVGQERFAWVVWGVLVTCALLGIRRLWRWPAERDSKHHPRLAAEAGRNPAQSEPGRAALQN